MSRPLARTLGAVALAAALATSSTAAFAATAYGDPAFYVTKEMATLAGLSPELRASAVQQAGARPNPPTFKGEGGTSRSGMSDLEIDLTCGGDWFISRDEGADGQPILGTFNLHCAGDSILIG